MTSILSNANEIFANLPPSELAEYISSKLWIVFVFMFVFMFAIVSALVLFVIKFVIKRNKNVPSSSVELTKAVEEFEKR